MEYPGAIFSNKEGRLRAGWRLLLQSIGFILLLVVVQGVFSTIAYRQNNVFFYILGSVINILGILGLLALFARWVDKRPIRQYGFRFNREWWLDLVVGFFLGAFVLVAVFLIEWSAGWLTITTISQSVFSVPPILVGVAAFLNLTAVGLVEEITFRAYEIRNLAESFSRGKGSKTAVVAALLVSSLIFGFAHGGNPGSTLQSIINIALAGLLLGWGYVLTGELALPLGLHIAWGFFEEFVFGFPNSGTVPQNWWIGSQVNGPALWTGGNFGPEGGLLVTILIVLDAVFITAWVAYRRRWTGIRSEIGQYLRAGDDRSPGETISPITSAKQS